ncbi:uncharacterized protein YacL [Dysgonomonadaceae bacterium PH5-43]|nr:uncharacterized protein YacL [Dysgonomonadaceae bacterium PH5-43]
MVSILLICIYVLLGLSLLAVLFFSIRRFIVLWKTDKRAVTISIAGIVSLLLLLLTTYILGSGEAWFKVIDMWIYSAACLLVLSLLAIIIGVIWSNIVNK